MRCDSAGTAGQCTIETREVLRSVTRRKMQGIGKVQTLPRQIERGRNHIPVFAAHLRQRDQRRERLGDPPGRERIEATENPFAFQ